jgi:hypothetical protein
MGVGQPQGVAPKTRFSGSRKGNSVNDSRIVHPSETPNPGPANPDPCSLIPDPSLHPADKLGSLLIKLMFAARRLVEVQTRRYGFSQAACAECQAAGFPGVIAHYPGCRTGEVEGLLSDLVNLYQTEVDRAAQTPAPPQGSAGEFGEPWVMDPDNPGNLKNANGIVVHDAWGTELIEWDDEDYAARIAACVNACAGVPTEALLRKARAVKLQVALFGQKPDETCCICKRATDLCVCGARIAPFQYPDVEPEHDPNNCSICEEMKERKQRADVDEGGAR